MRTIIEIPQQQLDQMKPVLEQEGISRAELIRRAINDYLKQYSQDEETTAFGVWAGQQKEGLAYQEQLRSEWD